MCKDRAAQINKVETLARSLARFSHTPTPDAHDTPADIGPAAISVTPASKADHAKANETETNETSRVASQRPSETEPAGHEPSTQAADQSASDRPTDRFDAMFIRARSDGSLRAQGVKTEVKVMRAFRRCCYVLLITHCSRATLCIRSSPREA